MPRSLLTAAAVLLMGCNSVSATVDGASAEGIQSAFFIEEDGYYGSDGIIQIYLTTISDGCTTYESYHDEINDLDWLDLANLAEEYEEIWTEHFPETMEETLIKIRVDDPDDSIAGLDYKGVDWNDGLQDDDETKASYTRVYQALDDDFWENSLFGGDTDDYLESWVSDDGDLSVAAHTVNESIRGTFTTSFAETDDGDDEGDATIRFNAERCQELESEIF